MKAVFTTKVGSGYDDIVEERYHFPSTYLGQVRNAIGDMVVYYEPRRRAGAASGGRQAYFAIARVTGIEADRTRPDHYYATIEDYLDFDRSVPFRSVDGYFESILQKADGETNKGAFGRAVRNINDREFDLIVAAGFANPTLSTFDRSSEEVVGFEEGDQAEFERPLVELTGTRLFRERAFARHVQDAYDRTCAMTGLQIINGGGRPEAQAAHIRPVSLNGPDSVRNGLALSATLHWMFDRGLVSVDDDYRILVAPKGVPERIKLLLNPSGKLKLPSAEHLQPHGQYLRFHRESVFKG